MTWNYLLTCRQRSRHRITVSARANNPGERESGRTAEFRIGPTIVAEVGWKPAETRVTVAWGEEGDAGCALIHPIKTGGTLVNGKNRSDSSSTAIRRVVPHWMTETHDSEACPEFKAVPVEGAQGLMITLPARYLRLYRASVPAERDHEQIKADVLRCLRASLKINIVPAAVEIAQAVGMEMKAVTPILAELKRDGVIDYGHAKGERWIDILDTEAMA